MPEHSLRFVSGVLLVAAAGGLFCSCKSEAERNLAAEVDRLGLKINQLRDAPNNRKAEPLKALAASPCKAPAACELKQVCVQGYSLHTKAISATAKLRQVLRSGEAAPEGAAELLQMSETNLARGQGLIARCTALQGELERAAH